jgi:hypothetical protein
MLNKHLNANPGLEKKLYNIELHTRKILAKKPDGVGNGNGGGNNGGDSDPVPYTGAVSIPVYFHIIQNANDPYINDAQVLSQLTVLNEDFNNDNSDIGDASSSGFGNILGKANISFTNAGITRTSTTKTSWPSDNSMKYDSSGGHDAITPETHLNIWVVSQIGSGTLGFAYYPGAAPAGADGVVIGAPYFGTQGSISSTFNLGRTATHEVGHYLNLRHIWGDGRCRQDDLVSDTPSSDRANYYCPGPTATITHCKSRDMHMNYMDYVDDACMYMFTQGQVDRMRANFASGGEREAMVK